MPTRSTWLPHPLLSLLLLLIWLLLNDSLAPGQFLLGATLGLLIPLFTERFWPERAHFRRPFLACGVGSLNRPIIPPRSAVGQAFPCRSGCGTLIPPGRVPARRPRGFAARRHLTRRRKCR